MFKERRGKEGKLARTLYIKGYDPEKMTSKKGVSFFDEFYEYPNLTP